MHQDDDCKTEHDHKYTMNTFVSYEEAVEAAEEKLKYEAMGSKCNLREKWAGKIRWERRCV